MNISSENTGFNPYESPGTNFGTVPAYTSSGKKPKKRASRRYSDDFAEAPFFSFSGRIGRVRAFAYLTFLDVVLYLAFDIIASMFSSGDGIEGLFRSQISALLIIIAIQSIYWLSITIRRLHDLNLSGWWIILFPILLFIFSGFLMHSTPEHWYMISAGIFLLATIGINLYPGTKGFNNYGLPSEPPSSLIVIFVCAFIFVYILYNLAN